MLSSPFPRYTTCFKYHHLNINPALTPLNNFDGFCFWINFSWKKLAKKKKIYIYIYIYIYVSFGEGNGTPLQHSCLKNPMDGGAWWAAVRGVTTSQTQLSSFTFTFHFMHWRRKWQPTPVFLPGESQGRESLVGCHLSGHIESDRTETT